MIHVAVIGEDWRPYCRFEDRGDPAHFLPKAISFGALGHKMSSSLFRTQQHFHISQFQRNKPSSIFMVNIKHIKVLEIYIKEWDKKYHCFPWHIELISNISKSWKVSPRPLVSPNIGRTGVEPGSPVASPHLPKSPAELSRSDPQHLAVRENHLKF